MTHLTPRLIMGEARSPDLPTAAPGPDEVGADVVVAAGMVPKNDPKGDLDEDLDTAQGGMALQLNQSRLKIMTARLTPELTIGSSWKDKPI